MPTADRLPAAPVNPAAASPSGTCAAVPVVLLAAALAVVLVANNYAYLFRAELIEYGDTAVNALQIRQAKAGETTLGTYSRWGFHHPGPAYFYLCAAAERIFHDGLHVVPTPHNAHVLAVIAIASLSLSYALWTIAARLPASRRFCFLAMALLFAALHFTAIGSRAVLSTWPPHVLAAPFLCFLVATASVASGDGRHLAVLAGAGGFLIHVHVAQPLFVVSLAGAAYLGLVFSRPLAGGISGRMASAWRAFPRAHVITLLVTMAFLTPMAIDASRGAQSNVAQIAGHVWSHRAAAHSFADATGYFLEFGNYRGEGGDSDSYGASAGWSAVASRLPWGSVGCWVAVIVVGAWLLGQYFRRDKEASALAGGERTLRRFISCLYGVAAGTVALSLVWGMKQEGELYFYNSFFNYSIYFLFLLLLALGLSCQGGSWARRLHPWTGPILSTAFLVAAAVVLVVKRDRLRTSEFNDADHRRVEKIITRMLESDPSPAAPILLSFTPQAWPAAAAVALQLDRAGRQFVVADSWEFMFGKQHTLSAKAGKNVEWETWRLVTSPLANHDAGPLREGYFLSRELASLDPGNFTIDFSLGGNGTEYSISGWSFPEAGGTWTDGSEAWLEFRHAAVTGDIWLTVDAVPFLVAGRIDDQPVSIFFDGAPLASAVLSAGSGPLTICIPRARWDGLGKSKLSFKWKAAASPASLRLGDDRRKLGAFFKTLTFASTPPPSARP